MVPIIGITYKMLSYRRPRCGERYSFRQKWKTETERQYFADMVYLQPPWYNRPENLSNSVKNAK